MAKDSTLDLLLDEALKGVRTADELFAKNGVIKQLQKRALERILEAEMTEHLGYEKHAREGFNGQNSRNGRSPKTVVTESGPVTLEVPRDREGDFDPQIVPKNVRRLKGFDDKVIALYARGLTVRDVRAHLKEIYDVDVSPDLISRITSQVWEDIRDWRKRELDPIYPIVYLDGMVVKVRDESRVVRNKTVYIALGLTVHGHKDVLGLWMAPTEGAKFWLGVLDEIKKRGVQDIFVMCCDGLTGLPDAIEAVFPKAIVQTCVVHMIRHSFRLVAWKNRRAVAKALKPIYTAATEKEGLEALKRFDAEWGKTYPSIALSWKRQWSTLSAFYGFPEEIRRIIYTTNAIESLNRQLRKVTKTRGAFPSEDAVSKLLWLALDKQRVKWTAPKPGWDRVMQQFAILLPDRLDLNTIVK